MLEKLQLIFRRVFNNNTLIITPDSSAKNIKMWDSITHMELIAEVETAFNILFSFEEVMQFNTVGDMIELIEKKAANTK